MLQRVGPFGVGSFKSGFWFGLFSRVGLASGLYRAVFSSGLVQPNTPVAGRSLSFATSMPAGARQIWSHILTCHVQILHTHRNVPVVEDAKAGKVPYLWTSVGVSMFWDFRSALCCSHHPAESAALPL